MTTFWGRTLSKKMMALCTGGKPSDMRCLALLTHAIIIWLLSSARCVRTASVFYVSLPSLATKRMPAFYPHAKVNTCHN